MVQIGGMGIQNPTEMDEMYFDMSISACSYLVRSLVEDGEFIQSAHMANVRQAEKSARVTRDLLDTKAME